MYRYMIYSLVFKHGLLEHPPFSDCIPGELDLHGQAPGSPLAMFHCLRVGGHIAYC